MQEYDENINVLRQEQIDIENKKKIVMEQL
jgi:hypothetical protein